MFLLPLVLAASYASAASITEGMACADDIKGAMENAAWLSAEREIEMAEEIMLKPDSVLQYSCFDNYVTEDALTQGLSNYINANFDTDTTGGALCVNMANIWNTLKCQDFDKDWFRTFEEMASSDPRQNYKPCNASGRTAAWNSALAAAYPAPGAAGGVDPLETHNDELYFMSGNSCDDSLHIPTGLTLEGGGEDHVCTKPGCYSDGSTCVP